MILAGTTAVGRTNTGLGVAVAALGMAVTLGLGVTLGIGVALGLDV